jgi:hypothetical protein
MSRIELAGLATVAITAAFTATAMAQPAPPPAPPLYAATKVEGTDNVYIFRYQGHQAMFVVTKDGVIATDPIGERRPAAKAYIEEIQKITKAPIKYVIYSHSHFDHIAGGKPFKDLGATFIAHKNAKARIAQLKPDDVVMPDQVVDGKKTITLGGTTLELTWVGRNHSDSTLIMRLPKEKIIFTVDWIPIEWRAVPRHGGHLHPGDRRLAQEGDRDGLGAQHSRPSRARRTARHQGRRQSPPAISAGPLGPGEAGGERRQELQRRHGAEASEIRELGRLRPVPADEHRALLRLLESGNLTTAEGPARVTRDRMIPTIEIGIIGTPSGQPAAS